MVALTLLVFSGIGVPPYSARGLSQSLDPIQQASNARRTIDGVMKNLAFDGFKKFKSTITCNDQQPPAVDGSWPGKIITVDCIAELCYLTSGGSPSRTVVTTRVEGAFTFYHPRITFMVLSFAVNYDEYGAAVSWSMQLEEV